MESIDFLHTTVVFKEQIVYFIFKENVELDSPEMRELFQAAEKLSKGKPFLLFSVLSGTQSITSEGRKFTADKKETRNLIANAVLTNSLALKLTANFFIKLNKPHFHFVLFNHATKAHEWLSGFAPEKAMPVSSTIPELEEAGV